MRTINLFIFSALLFFACASSYAQVTIGEGADSPVTGALLDLAKNGGLILSNVTITDLEKIPADNDKVFPGITNLTADINPGLGGAMVYNDGLDPAVPAGIYIWSGYSWTKDGRIDPASLPEANAGTFSAGTTCFDIALTDGGDECGGIRTQQYSFASTRTEIYTFNNNPDDLSFAYKNLDSSNVIRSISQGTDNNKNQVTVTFNTDLNARAAGRARLSALEAELYAVFTEAGELKQKKLTLSVADCGCD
jgi:hypothetical protein